MPFGTRCGSLILVLGVLAAAPALAQGETPAKAPPQSAWTDPPVRGSVGPDPATTTAKTDKPADAGPAKVEPAPASAVARTDAAPARRSIRHAARSRPVRAREAVRPAPRTRTVQAEPARSARAVSRPVRRVETVSVAPPRRSMRERGHGRYYATAEAARLSVGRGTPAYPPGYALRRRAWAEAEDGSPYDGPADVRSVRFAEDRAFARPPAYRVMRLRTVTFPDGRVMQTLHPVEGGPDGD